MHTVLNWPIKHSKDLWGRLVYGAKDGVVLLGHGLQCLHNGLGHKCVQARGGLITKQQWWIGQHLRNTTKTPWIHSADSNHWYSWKFRHRYIKISTNDLPLWTRTLYYYAKNSYECTQPTLINCIQENLGTSTLRFLQMTYLYEQGHFIIMQKNS